MRKIGLGLVVTLNRSKCILRCQKPVLHKSKQDSCSRPQSQQHARTRGARLCKIFSNRLYFMQSQRLRWYNNESSPPLPTKPILAPCLVRASVHQKIHEQDAVFGKVFDSELMIPSIRHDSQFYIDLYDL